MVTGLLTMASVSFFLFYYVTLFEACLVLKVIFFSKLISLIYFNIFIEEFELLMLVSSLIYLAFLAFFCTGNKVVCCFFF